MNMIIFSAIIVIVLFVTCFFKYRAAVQSTDRKPQTMNNKKKKHFIGFFTSEHFKDVIIQLCIVILGAYIALVYTNDHEYQQTMQRTYSEFRVAADDMETQSKLNALILIPPLQKKYYLTMILLLCFRIMHIH